MKPGNPWLTRLAKKHKALPAQEQLKTLVTVKHQGKLLLELAAMGKMDAVLEVLGASSTENSTDNKVVPLC